MCLERFGSREGRAEQSFLINRRAKRDTLEQAILDLVVYGVMNLGGSHVKESMLLLPNHLLIH